MADKRLSNRAMTFQWRSKTPSPTNLSSPPSFLSPPRQVDSNCQVRTGRRIKRSLLSPPPLLFAYQKNFRAQEAFCRRSPPPSPFTQVFFVVQGAEIHRQSICPPSACLVYNKLGESWVGKNRREGQGLGTTWVGSQQKSRNGWVRHF